MKAAIAVVTPVFNGEESIQKAINSLLAQTFTNWVNIIVNDGSTDGTSDILKKYRGDSRFIIINFPENKGRPYARQSALDKIRKLGIKYMAMLDADDWYYPDKLEFQHDFMEKHPKITLLSMSFGLINKNNELFGVTSPYKKTTNLHFKKYNEYQMVPHASAIIRMRDIGLKNYNLALVYGEDQDFFRRILVDKQYVYIPKIKYLYTREQSFSYAKYRKSKILYLKSYVKLPISNFSKLKTYLKEYIKLIIVFLLCKTGKNDFYFKQIGRKPTKKEIKSFQQNKKFLAEL